MVEPLSDAEIAEQLPDDWKRDQDEIVRVYEFDDYLDGIDFVSDIGEVAEDEFHHPNIEVRYEEVEVRLTTHEADGLTENDMRLAGLFDQEYEEYE